MTPMVILGGYVCFLERKDNVTRFKLQVYRGEKNAKRDGQKEFYVQVKMFGTNDEVFNGVYAWVSGRLDGHKYNGRNIIEVLCFPQDIMVRSPVNLSPDLPPGYPLPPGENDENFFM